MLCFITWGQFWKAVLPPVYESWRRRDTDCEEDKGKRDTKIQTKVRHDTTTTTTTGRSMIQNKMLPGVKVLPTAWGNINLLNKTTFLWRQKDAGDKPELFIKHQLKRAKGKRVIELKKKSLKTRQLLAWIPGSCFFCQIMKQLHGRKTSTHNVLE